MKKYFLNILISLDQLVNTLLGGSPDETISSRLERNYDGTLIERCVNWLFSGTTKGEHCKESLEPIENEKDTILK
jgi:hypothetical protein